MKLLTSILITILFIIPSSATTFFSFDHENDENYDTVLHDNLIRLRQIEKFIPFHAEWDEQYIWVECEYKKVMFDPSSLPEGMTIINNTTYITPHRLSLILDKTSFFYDGELYICSDVIGEFLRGSENFKKYAATSLLKMKFNSPDIYNIIRENLTGGIKSVELTNEVPFGTKAYVYTKSENPICYIIGEPSGDSLAGYITHEAFHVWQWRKYGITGEDIPKKMEKYILNLLGGESIK